MLIILIVRIAVFISFIVGMVTLTVNVAILRKIGKKTTKDIKDIRSDVVTLDGRVAKVELRVTTLEQKHVARTDGSNS